MLMIITNIVGNPNICVIKLNKLFNLILKDLLWWWISIPLHPDRAEVETCFPNRFTVSAAASASRAIPEFIGKACPATNLRSIIIIIIDRKIIRLAALVSVTEQVRYPTVVA